MSAPLNSKTARELLEAYQSIYASSVEKEMVDQEVDINEGAASMMSGSNTERQKQINKSGGRDTGLTAKIGTAVRNWLNPPRSQSADPVVRRGGSYTGPGGAPKFPSNSSTSQPSTSTTSSSQGSSTPQPSVNVKPGEKYGPGDGPSAASKGTIGGLLKKTTPATRPPAATTPPATRPPAATTPPATRPPATKPATAGTYSSQFKKSAPALSKTLTKKEPTMKSDLGGRLGKALSGNVSDFQFKDSYDMVLDYLLSGGHVASVEEAHYVMLEMDQETILDICEGRSSRPRYPGGRGVLDTERRQDKRDAAAENLKGHTFGPATTTKNPKKLRKQKAMGEIEENFELWVNGLVEEGYNLSDYTWDEMYEFYLDELYKGKHGQSEEDYMDSRSDAGKQISGDSKHSGASYSHRSYRGVGEPARPGKRQKNQGRMTQADRDELKIRKANLKKRN